MERLTHAAVRLDVDGMKAAALALKQMSLCHGPFFDLLAIAAYRLQQASATGSARRALMHLAPVAEAAAHTTQLLMLEAAQPPLVCSLRAPGGGGVSFFSHVIGEMAGDMGPGTSRGSNGSNGANSASTLTGMASALLSHSGLHVPPVDAQAGAETFSGDALVLARAMTSFVQLVPPWLRSTEYALERLQLLLLRSEAWVLKTTAGLIGAHRLAALAHGLQLAVDDLEPPEALHKRLLLIRSELRLVLAHAAQPEPQQMISPPAPPNTATETISAPRNTPVVARNSVPVGVRREPGHLDGVHVNDDEDAFLSDAAARIALAPARWEHPTSQPVAPLAPHAMVASAHSTTSAEPSGTPSAAPGTPSAAPGTPSAAPSLLSLNGQATPRPNGQATPSPNGQATPHPNGQATPSPNGQATPHPNGQATPGSRGPWSVHGGARQSGGSPLVCPTPAGSIRGVTERALRYLIDATYDACDAALGEGAYVGQTVVSETGQTIEMEPSGDLVTAIETSRAAAAMIEGLLMRASQRRASLGAQVLS